MMSRLFSSEGSLDVEPCCPPFNAGCLKCVLIDPQHEMYVHLSVAPQWQLVSGGGPCIGMLVVGMIIVVVSHMGSPLVGRTCQNGVHDNVAVPGSTPSRPSFSSVVPSHAQPSEVQRMRQSLFTEEAVVHMVQAIKLFAELLA